MEERTNTPAVQRPPMYWVLLGIGFALIATGWIGERQGWSATLTFVLFFSGTVALAADGIFFRRGTRS